MTYWNNLLLRDICGLVMAVLKWMAALHYFLWTSPWALAAREDQAAPARHHINADSSVITPNDYVASSGFSSLLFSVGFVGWERKCALL